MDHETDVVAAMRAPAQEEGELLKGILQRIDKDIALHAIAAL